MILVTGATGTVGREVVRLLRERGQEVRAATRDASRAATHAPREDGLSYVPFVPFDFGRHETYEPALRRADAVFLIGERQQFLHFWAMCLPSYFCGEFSPPFWGWQGTMSRSSRLGTVVKRSVLVTKGRFRAELSVTSRRMRLSHMTGLTKLFLP